MKTKLTLFALVLLTCSALFPEEKNGSDPFDPIRPGQGHGQQSMGMGLGMEANRNNSSLRTLDQFLQLSDEQLKELEDTIRRIRQMSPGERQAYREKIAQYRQMSPEQKQNIQQAWGRLDTRVRTAWRDYMMGLSPEERTAVHDELQGISPEEKTLWRIEVLKRSDKLPEGWSLSSPGETETGESNSEPVD